MLARQIVRGKIGNCTAVLFRHHANHPDSSVERTIEKLRLVAVTVEECSSLGSLRGHEGTAARFYFQVFGNLLRHHSFPGRKRRPPTDPANALLSYTYSILAGELSAALEEAGLDPYAGFFHELKPGRPSLALDLLEPWRPWVADRFVLRLLNRKHLRNEHFQQEKRARGSSAYYLTTAGKQVYFRKLETWLDEAASKLPGKGSLARKEALDFREHCVGGNPGDWRPFVFAER